MKRLVICCDGTWKRADEINVSNIEKIARAVDPEPSGGPVQIAYYSSGVGTGATRTDRVLGGAFGLGLDTALVGAYRFLALNYNPGDEVFVFGFSRGAYTARSLVGIISRIGLLTSDGVARNELKNAIAVYRNDTPASSKDKESFRKLCHPESDVEIGFLGVFDTVGTMGVPGLGRRKYGFHNVELAPCVRFARCSSSPRTSSRQARRSGPRAGSQRLWTRMTRRRRTSSTRSSRASGCATRMPCARSSRRGRPGCVS